MKPSESVKANCVFLVLLDGNEPLQEHLGIGYLVAVLRGEGHHCTVIAITPDEDESVVDRIVALDPHFVGIGLISIHLPRVRVIGQALRAKLGPGVHICAGGCVATHVGEKLLKHPDFGFFDSIVRGEGESVISALITAVLNEEPVYNIVGVATPDHPHTPLAVRVSELDSLPWAARDQLEKSLVGLSTSRSCTGNCTFCNAPHAGNRMGGKWRGRSPEDVVNEIESLVSKHSVDTFRIWDSTYEDPPRKGKQRIKRIAELILERGLRIYYDVCSTTHTWTEDDIDLLRLLFDSGLERVLFGFESGSERVLRMFKKRATMDDHRRAIRLFRQSNVYIGVGFMMFHPYFDWQIIEDNINFLASEDLAHVLTRFIYQLEVYPGTEVERQLEADGLLEPGYYEHFDPLAYRYLDPDIGNLARRLSNCLFGQDWMRHGMRPRPHPGVSSLIIFQRYDIKFHTYLTRLLRLFGDDPIVRAVIDEYQHIYNQERASLTKFNLDIMEDILVRAKAGQDISANTGMSVEERYDIAMQSVESMHMRLTMRLARHKIDFREVDPFFNARESLTLERV